DESGNAYSGTVSVSAFHLQPSDENLSILMPGMLYAEDSNGNEKALETYGMLQVELRGSGGQKLQLASGHTAEIDVMIDPSQMASAPSTIPMWHFDEANGYWKQDGTATKTGNFYKANVSHFSWWNCDAQFPTVSLTIKLVDANGNPLFNTLVGLIRTGVTYTVNGLTNANGLVSGLVPANESLTMNVSDNCGNIIYTTTIGPFSSNTTLPDFTIPNGTVQSTLVQGTLLQCDTSAVTDGYVVLHYGSQTYFSTVGSNGVFSFNTLVCNTANVNFSLEGYDYVNVQTTGLTNYTFTFPTTNIGSISTCGAVAEYINYSIDGGPLVTLLTSVGGGIDGNYIFASGSNGNNYVNISGMATTTGSYTTAQPFFITIPQQFTIDSSIPNNVIFNVNTIDPVGGYIDISFSGPYTDALMIDHTINGTAHVIRNN
ncbi:MAG TPA: hypothetical protein VK623_00975, partial [Flavobacterium sp.]|nr:hypothetical protein [Flavobacterium sp.]